MHLTENQVIFCCSWLLIPTNCTHEVMLIARLIQQQTSFLYKGMKKILPIFLYKKKKNVSYVPGDFEVSLSLSDIYCSAIRTQGSYSTV